MGGVLKYLILVALIVAGCGKKPFQKRIPPPDAFAEYVVEFESLLGSEIYNIYFAFGDLNSYATCARSTGTITVDETRWADLCPLQRRALIFHELGHCVLMRDHTNDGDPISYMNPALRTCTYYEQNIDALDAELFN